MRIIDADALKEAIIELNLDNSSHWPVIHKIDNAPTVDTTCPNCDSGYAQGYSDGYLKGKEERPQGEWISANNGYYCDKCYGKQWYRSYYCAQCGAVMRVCEEAEND